MLKLFTSQLMLGQHYKTSLLLTTQSCRLFSRAEILKSLDRSKISRRQFIKKELTENPEFFKAFPHMQAVFNVNDEAEKINDEAKYFDDQQIGFKEQSTEEPYFDTLLHHHNQYMGPKEKEEAMRENEKNFVEGYQSPTGPMKYLTKEQIQKTHTQIDKKMQELEESGLTREEILYDQQRGIPLIDDPFFQFVKNSRTAREMLIKPGEEFTVEKVIEKALRQDIGPDPTLAMARENYKYVDPKNPTFPIWEYKKKYRDRDPVLNPEAYFYDYKLIERRQRQFDFDQEKPATFINRPLSRSSMRKKFMRRLKKSDITWRNTALLCKFMNDTGKILNRYQTRLKSGVHRKVAKTIKKVRDLDLIAHVGMVKPTDRIPIGSFIEDLEEMHKKTIDPITGRMFLKHNLQDELSVKDKRIFEKLEDRFAEVETKAEFDEDLQAEQKLKIIREMSLDNEKLIPDRAQRHWLTAQAHILDREGLLKEKEEEAAEATQDYSKPDLQFAGAKDAYEESLTKIKNNNPTANNLFDNFLSEKALDVKKVYYHFSYIPQFDKKIQQQPPVEQLKESAEKVQIKEDTTDYEIRERIKRILDKYANPMHDRQGYHPYEREEKWKVDNPTVESDENKPIKPSAKTEKKPELSPNQL